jgi:hypothetical protein
MHSTDTAIPRGRHRFSALVLAGTMALAAAAAPLSVLAQDQAISVSTASDDLGT